MKKQHFLVAFLAVLVAFVSKEARADDPAPIAPFAEPPLAREDARGAPVVLEEAPPPPRRATLDRLRFGLGVRTSWISDTALSPYADTNTLSQLSLEASYTFLARPKFALSAGLGWDLGARSDNFRGLDSALFAQRLSVPLEARWIPCSTFYGFARVAPGVNVARATLHDPSAPTTLTDTAWAFSTDVSVGGSIALASGSRTRRTMRVWLTPELGYGFAFASGIRPATDRDEKAKLGSDEPVDLGSLSLGGVFFRAGIHVTY